MMFAQSHHRQFIMYVSEQDATTALLIMITAFFKWYFVKDITRAMGKKEGNC